MNTVHWTASHLWWISKFSNGAFGFELGKQKFGGHRPGKHSARFVIKPECVHRIYFLFANMFVKYISFDSLVSSWYQKTQLGNLKFPIFERASGGKFGVRAWSLPPGSRWWGGDGLASHESFQLLAPLHFNSTLVARIRRSSLPAAAGEKSRKMCRQCRAINNIPLKKYSRQIKCWMELNIFGLIRLNRTKYHSFNLC